MHTLNWFSWDECKCIFILINDGISIKSEPYFLNDVLSTLTSDCQWHCPLTTSFNCILSFSMVSSFSSTALASLWVLGAFNQARIININSMLILKNENENSLLINRAVLIRPIHPLSFCCNFDTDMTLTLVKWPQISHKPTIVCDDFISRFIWDELVCSN